MSSMQRLPQCAGSDTRPQCLIEQTLNLGNHVYVCNCPRKDKCKRNIMKSIKEGPFQMGTVSDVITGGTEGAVQQGPVRARVLNDLSAEEKERYKATDRSTHILLRYTQRHLLTSSITIRTPKTLGENVKMILKRNISGYYVRLRSSLRHGETPNTDVQNAANQRFVNNMLPEWSRFITKVKLNRGLKESNCDQLYAYLKQHEVHANENRIMMERLPTLMNVDNSPRMIWRPNVDHIFDADEFDAFDL
ncbi:hypothetical protein Tco_0752312 [Tanacetum coccineum]|uniref:Uncharacterized protein n=1 Tax=Tanacetum coccineum TaxID=301880 RepID=A0ABQ4Z931_9ASTR